MYDETDEPIRHVNLPWFNLLVREGRVDGRLPPQRTIVALQASDASGFAPHPRNDTLPHPVKQPSNMRCYQRDTAVDADVNLATTKTGENHGAPTSPHVSGGAGSASAGVSDTCQDYRDAPDTARGAAGIAGTHDGPRGADDPGRRPRRRLTAGPIYPWSGLAGHFTPAEDDEQAAADALADAIEAGDCDADGEPVPYDWYRNV